MTKYHEINQKPNISSFIQIIDVKGLVAEFASPHAQSGGLVEENVQGVGLATNCNYLLKIYIDYRLLNINLELMF